MQKKSYFLFICVVSGIYSLAQPPQKFNYQAVIRNSSGSPVINQAVSLRFSIHNLVALGSIQYSETQAVTTNAFGLANVQVGTGKVISGSFSNITWGTGSKFLQIEADITGGTTYANLASVELTSVPFALYAPPSTNSGDIVPYASGAPVILNNPPGFLLSTGSIIGFGSSANITLLASINLASLPNYAFSMPRNGTITSISGFFSTSTAITTNGPIRIKAQLYSATGTSNVFTAVTNALITLAPAFSGTLPVGTISQGIISGLNIPVTAQTRLLMVYYCTSTLFNSNTIYGYVSGGMNIQ